MSKAVAVILLIIFSAGLTVAIAMRSHQPADKVPAIIPLNKEATDIINLHLADATVRQLQTGDVVLRMGTGADSYMLSQMSKKDKRYSHCGIVMVENGYPFVYHSIGGETNPDERMRRDSACLFFSPVHNTAIAVVRYNFNGSKLAELKKTVAGYYRSRPRFDMQFDLKTDDKLYCSEFIYKAVSKVMHDTGFIHITPGAIRRYVGIDDLYLNPHAQIVSQVKFKRYICQPN